MFRSLFLKFTAVIQEPSHFAMPSLPLSSFLLPRAPSPMNFKEEEIYPDAEIKEEIENEMMLEVGIFPPLIRNLLTL